MADGFVLGTDLSNFEKKLKDLTKKSDEFEKNITRNFQNIGKNGIEPLLKQLDGFEKKLNKIGGTKKNKSPLDYISRGAKKTLDDVNRVSSSLNKIMVGGKSYSNNAFVKINSEIKSLEKELDRLTARRKQFGITSVDTGIRGNVDKESAAIRQMILLLQKEKERIIENSKIKIRESEKTAKRTREWVQMEKNLQEQKRKAEQESINATKKASIEREKAHQREAKTVADGVAKIINSYNKLKEAEGKARFQSTVAGAKELRERRFNSYEGSLRFANKASNLSQEIQAVKHLQKARENLSKTDSDYQRKLLTLNAAIKKHQREIDIAKDKSNQLSHAHRGLMDISGQLQRRLALVFSVSQITSYVNKLISVRGEFELQKRSLQAILQNEDKANVLWDKTVQLAVRSPFRVKELVTYTKQLAAYRIESDKLYETNKMLADVSAGLGVQMNRLILAYGQVKAANYLRGTELRQFSEAGVNILGELAEQFTKVEGRVVSVGEVFERVSKRLVTFEDVSKVFKKITSEGGIFYNMQEIQAETLKGQISNLYDSVDLMLNKIGEDQDGTLKTAVGITRKMVENWEAVADAIKLAIAALASYKIYMIAARLQTENLAIAEAKLASMTTTNVSLLKAWNIGLKKLSITARMFGATLKSAFLTNLPLLAVTALIGGIVSIYNHNKNLSASIREVNDEREKEVAKVRELYDAYNKANKSGKEENDIILEKKKILENLVDYAKDKGIEIPIKIGEISQKDIDDKAEEIKDRILFASGLKADLNKFIQEGYGEWEMGGILGENLKSDIEDFDEAVRDISTGDKQVIDDFFKFIGNHYDEISEKSKKFYDEINAGKKENESDFSWTMRRIQLTQMLAKSTYSLQKENEQYYSKALRIGEIEGKRVKINLAGAEAFSEIDKVSKKLLKEFGVKSFSEMDDWQKKIAELVVGHLFDSEKLEKFTKNSLSNRIKLKIGLPVEFVPEEKETIKFTEKWQEEVWNAINEKTFWDELKKGEKKETVEQRFISSLGFSFSKESINKTKEQVKNYVRGLIETQEGIIKDHGIDGQKIISDTEFQKAKELLPKLKEIGAIVGLSEENGKEKNKKEKEALAILKNRISLVKELNSQYNELKETFDSATAKEKVMESYSETFEKAFRGTGVDFSDIVQIDESKIKSSVGVISEAVEKELESLRKKGTYIRNYSDNFIEDFIVKYEGFRDKAYNIGDGRWTIGFGDTLGVREGDTIKREEAEARLRKRLTDDYVDSLNKVLNLHKDIVLTQEQYDALLDLTYQGGAGAVSNLIKYSKDVNLGLEQIEKVYKKVRESLGDEYANRFGDDFLKRFQEAKNVYERMSMLLETMNLTVNGGDISNKLYSGMQKRSDDRASVFKGMLNVSNELEKVLVNIGAIDFTNLQGMVEIFRKLMPIAKKEGKESVITLMKAISEASSEIGKVEKTKSDKEILEDIEDMFGDYEISIDLEKINFPQEIAKRIFNLDAMGLEELKRKVEGFKHQITGEQSVKEYEKYIKKIEELEDKARVERLKKYTKYLAEAQTERIKIKLEELRKLEEVERESRFEEGDRTDINSAIQKESIKKMQELEWKEFKDSDMYIRIFEDLGNMSDSVLKTMEQRLTSVKDSLKELSPTEIKEVVSSIEKIQRARFEQKNIFEQLADSVRRFRKLAKKTDKDELEKAYIESENKKLFKKKDTEWLEKQVGISEHYYKVAVKSYGIDSEQAKKAKEVLDTNKKNLRVKLAELEAQGKISAELAKQLREWADAEEDLGKSVSGIADKVAQAFDALPQVAGDLEHIFGNMDAKTKDIIDSAAAIGGGTAKAVSQFASQDYIGGVVSAIGVVSQIFQIGDKRKERSIQKEIKFVEDLQKQYEKLGESIEKAYSVDTLNKSMQLSDKNIREQIESRKEMIRLEEDKKKTDHDRIKQWNQEIEDLQKQQEELHKQQVENMGGTYDYKSAAEGFINAWLDAFKETGDGLDGLKGHFKEFASELLLKQAVMTGAANIIEPLESMITDALKNDYTIDDLEWNNIDNIQSEQLQKLDEFLRGFYGKYEGILGEGSSMSGLQRGIQEITESTAQIIEAYLNSIRLYVSDTNNKFTKFVESYMNTESENPMISQLKIIARQTSSINSLLDSVVKAGPGQGGAGIKVFME